MKDPICRLFPPFFQLGYRFLQTSLSVHLYVNIYVCPYIRYGRSLSALHSNKQRRFFYLIVNCTIRNACCYNCNFVSIIATTNSFVFFSQGTSKAGGSWSESNQSSKAQAMDSSSAGTSNPGEKPKQPHQNSYPSSEFLRNFIQTFEAPTTAASTRKEPGEANSNIKLGLAHRTTTAEDRNGRGFSDDVHTGEGIRRTDVSQGASNTAVSLTPSNPSNSDKLSSQATSKAGGSWNASAASGTDQSSFLCQGNQLYLTF